jgi:ABC-2 type transport system ATP-binding protein
MYHLMRWLIRNWRSRRTAAQTQNQTPGAPTTTDESAADEPVTDGAAGDNAADDEPSASARPARPAVRLVTAPPPVPPGPGGEVSGSPALSVNGLTKRFGDRVAFSDVSFEVGYGEVFGFLGPNGAGKTTTVRTLGTLFAPTSGSATVAGLPLTPGNGAEIRRRIAIMPESPGLYLRLSVAENLEYFADLYDAPDPRDRIDRALRAVRLVDRAQDPCGALSKGLRQRVALARALLSDPTVLFLDEPTAGLDPVAARDVHELIDELRQRGVTIFLTTHRLEEAERLCDRVAILNRTLRTVGRPEELRERMFAKSLTVRTLAPLPEPGRVFAGLPAVDSWQQDGAQGYAIAVSDTQIAAPAVTRALVQAGADVLSVGESRHSLEDVYLELIDTDEEASRE